MDGLRATRPLALAVYIVCVFAGTFQGPLLMIGWCALGIAVIGWYVTPEKPKQDLRVWVLLGVLVVSHMAAIPGSIWFGTGNWILTASAVYWLLPAMVIFLIADDGVFRWLIWIAVIHAGCILFNGMWFSGVMGYTSGEVNKGGLTFNPNVAAGLLIIGIGLVFWTGRHWWAVLPMITAVIFTGSRAAFSVLVIVFVSSLITGQFTWRSSIGMVVFIIIAVAVYGLLHQQSQVADYPAMFSMTPDLVINDINVRWTVPAWPDLYPHGVVEHLGLHNVPLRMAREAGIIAGAVWLVLSVWALTRDRWTPAWWLMVVILLLSILDHYTWRVHLGSLWFLAAGLLLSRSANIRPISSPDRA